MSIQQGLHTLVPRSSGPYPATTASLGGVPTKTVDVPISAVVLFLFICGAACHMTLLQINLRRGHKFVLSGVCFGLCMARITANVLRIAWAFHHTNINLAIAAGVMANAGVVLLFVVNLIFTQRLLRAYHPRIGWSLPGKIFFRFLYTSVGLSIVMLITAIVYTFFTLDASIREQLHKVSLTGSTFLDVLAFIPIPILILILVLPGRVDVVDEFGKGSMRTKFAMIFFTATILTFGATMRATSSYIVRPRNHPGWFDAKALYYCGNYGVEIICIYFYAFMRIDQRFYIPDGSYKYGHYRNGVPDHEKKQHTKKDHSIDSTDGGSEMELENGNGVRQGQAI